MSITTVHKRSFGSLHLFSTVFNQGWFGPVHLFITVCNQKSFAPCLFMTVFNQTSFGVLFCLCPLCLFSLFVLTSLWSNVWKVSSLKSHSLCPNSEVALTDWLIKDVFLNHLLPDTFVSTMIKNWKLSCPTKLALRMCKHFTNMYKRYMQSKALLTLFDFQRSAIHCPKSMTHNV